MTTPGLKEKLAQLRAELEKGQQQMAVIEQRRQEVRDTVLRIAGAIQVIEELLAAGGQPEAQTGRENA